MGITGDTPEGKLALSIPLPLQSVTRPKPLVHRMAARALIRDLEEETSDSPSHRTDPFSPDLSDEATRLSLHFSVLCHSTAFVAVDSQTGTIHPVDINKRVVPQPGTLSHTAYDTQMLLSSASMALCSANMSSVATLRSTRRKMCSDSGGVGNPFTGAAKKSSGGYGFPQFFSNMFKGSSYRKETEEKATRAALGGQSSVYYDQAKGRWREAGGEEEEANSTAIPPPPKMKQAEVLEAKAEGKMMDGATQKSLSVPAGHSRMKALESLLLLAAANGSFKPAAQPILGIKDASMCKWATELSTTTDILLTALVLAHLRRDFPDEKEAWSLVECKSLAWLQKQDHAWKNDIEALISHAASKVWL